MLAIVESGPGAPIVSVLFYEPKLLKSPHAPMARQGLRVSVLFYEPKLLKFS